MSQGSAMQEREQEQFPVHHFRWMMLGFMAQSACHGRCLTCPIPGELCPRPPAAPGCGFGNQHGQHLFARQLFVSGVFCKQDLFFWLNRTTQNSPIWSLHRDLHPQKVTSTRQGIDFKVCTASLGSEILTRIFTLSPESVKSAE